MLRHLRAAPVPIPPSFRESLTLETVRGRISALDGTLAADPASFQAALILLSAVELGQNVYRLSLFTEVDARVVARCARRLIDNAIWMDGVTWGAWTDPAVGRAAFRADVQVSLGHACRRTDADGMLRWAAAGEWWKHFDYATRDFDDACVIYDLPVLASDGSGQGDEFSGEEEEEGTTEISVDLTWARESPEVAAVPLAAADWIGIGTDEFGQGRGVEETASAFPAAIWLG